LEAFCKILITPQIQECNATQNIPLATRSQDIKMNTKYQNMVMGRETGTGVKEFLYYSF
jgi:hypothetical protein